MVVKSRFIQRPITLWRTVHVEIPYPIYDPFFHLFVFLAKITQNLSKARVYLLGIVTLLMVPLAWLLQGMPSIGSFFRAGEIMHIWTLIGIEFGAVFAFLMLALTNTDDARDNFSDLIRTLQSMKLNLFDCIFLSLCAGFGEEFLFRIALQEWLHPLLTSVVFVAIHGYLRPRNWEVTKYGLVLLPFIVVLGYAVSEQGIGFCIGAHAAYDFVLFYSWSTYKSVD